MRQFVSWRWWLTILALAGLVIVLVAVVGPPGGDELDDAVRPTTRRLDLVARAQDTVVDDDWRVRRGVTEGNAQVTIDGRVYSIAPGTLGEIECDVRKADCVLLADRLGDAIVWFTLLELDDGANELRLPAIDVPLDGVTWARLTNGWELPLLGVVERRCEVETANFSDFLERFGDDHITFLDVDEREISAVRCTRS
jgi:hypothetical protein